MGEHVGAHRLEALLFDHPATDGEPLLHTVDRSRSAGEARAAARSWATRLAAVGVAAGQPVAVQLADPIDAVEAMIGVWTAGAVFVPVNPRSPEAEVRANLAATCPAALVTADGIAPLDDPTSHRPDDAFVTWTSGTSGAPKPVLHTHSGYLELLDRVIGPLRAGGSGSAASRERTPSPNLVPVPLALNAGIYNVLFGLRVGAEIVLLGRFDTATFATLVARFAIRSTVLPPAAMAMLTDDPSVTSLEPLRYVRSITAPLSPLQATRFAERFDVTVLNGYGQAEIGEVIGWTAADARAHPGKLGAVGRPHPGVDVKVLTDDGRQCDPDEVGELLVRPPRRAEGYADGGDLGERVDAEGFVRTGDLARIDRDGFVWIEGRLGEAINRGGSKVFPNQVEEVLTLAAGVREAAVVGVPDDRLGEVPVAFLVLDPDTPGPDDESLVAVCRSHLAPFKVPVAFHRVASLPRNEVGKVLRRALVAEHEGRA